MKIDLIEGRGDGGTHTFVNIPTAILPALGRFRHSLVGLEMPVQMACLLFLTFVIGKETPPAGPASIRLGFIESAY
jgi:hypothetical protein